MKKTLLAVLIGESFRRQYRTEREPQHGLCIGSSPNSVTGNDYLGGGAPTFSFAQSGLTAFAGGAQASATALAVGLNRVTTVATAGDSVKLPAATAGAVVTVINKGAAAMDVFPATGDAINGQAVNIAVRQMVNSLVRFACALTGQWESENLSIGFASAFATGAFTNAITAFAGGGQASAVALTTGLNRITVVATAGDSVKLPSSAAGMVVIVHTAAALAPDVFPATGDAINNLGANTALRQPSNTTAIYHCEVAGTWQVQVPVRGAKYTKNTTSGATVAAAGDLTGVGVAYVQAEYSAVGAANLTTRTAALMIADGALQIGDSYVLEITNTSGGTTTLVAGSGVTVTGTMTMATNTTRRFNVLVTGAATITIQSTGVGTIS